MDYQNLFDDIEPIITNKTFQKEYLCYPFIHHPNLSDEKINRLQKTKSIILPDKALEHLSHFSLNDSESSGPMVFKLMYKNNINYAPVEEFHPVEKVMFAPDSIIEELGINHGDRVQIDKVNVPTATYIEFKPEKQFLQLSNPKIVLERYLRNYKILYKDQIIPINYLGKTYNILVKNLEPAEVVLIVDADINMDFTQYED